MAAGLLLGVLVLALGGAAVVGRPPAGDAAPEAVRRTLRRWRSAGLVLGVAAAGIAVEADDLGRGVLVAAPLFGLCVLAGVVTGEARAVRLPDPVRTAAVETRHLRHFLPGRAAAAVAAAGFALAALLALTTVAGSADDLGRAGRALSYACADFAGRNGPWPGSFYSLPLSLVVGAGAVLAALALRRVVGRPRPVDDAGDLVRDDAERRRSARAVTGAGGLLVTLPLIGVSLTTASALLANPCRPLWWTVAASLLLLLVPGWLALLAWSAVAVVTTDVRPSRATVTSAR
ncbi:hypothetical protein AB0H57_19805 [Micromonospora sp. NPDC050686]|uniref:hypothetical protein n=1 Tax=Micromonospora sp. NPDC050686 TaxID=3154631 RepID=UPI0033D4651A